MVKEKYLLRAESLVQRDKSRLNENYTPKEKETDKLFYWIMSRLERCMQGCMQTSYNLTIKEEWNYGEIVILTHGTVDKYLLDVERKEFYLVIKDVANIFNEIGKSEEKGYEFHARTIIPKAKYRCAEMVVRMTCI